MTKTPIKPIEFLLEQMLINNYISKKQFENADWLIKEANEYQEALLETSLFKEREMLVSDDGENWRKLIVFCRNPKLEKQYLSYVDIQGANLWSWKYAKEIELEELPKEDVTLTLEQIAEKFGVDVEQITIRL